MTAAKRLLALVWWLAALNAITAIGFVVNFYVLRAGPAAGAEWSPPDFAAFWAAGRLALAGQPALAYDWAVHRAVEVAALGDFAGWMPWHYPPPFQLLLAPLAAVPFWPAMALWVGATFAFFAWTCRRILPGPLAPGLAIAAAPTAMTVANGQTGFLLAGLLGSALLVLERRPASSGALLGLLVIKPHLFLAVPLALAAGRHWRTIAAAAGAALAVCLLSLIALGPETWARFLGSFGETSAVFAGEAGKFRMYATAYGAARLAGLDFGPSLLLHGLVALPILGLLLHAWSRPGPGPALKAALLCYALAAVAPRLLNYDLNVVLIGALFQLRAGRATGLSRAEAAVLLAALVGAYASMLAAPGINAGLAAALFFACWLTRARRVPDRAAASAA